MALDIQKTFVERIQEFIDQGLAVPVPKLEELDPKGHITQEVLDRLVMAIPVGNPRKWMKEYINNQDEKPIDSLPKEFRDFYDLLSEAQKIEIKACSSLMTTIANLDFIFKEKYQKENPEVITAFKELYRFAEMRIMYFVKTKVQEMVNEGLAEGENKDPRKVLNLFALRGARILENQYSFGIQKEVEMKRMLKLKEEGASDDDNEYLVGEGEASEDDEEYLVGVGAELKAILEMSQEEKDMIEDVILPDDCVSTGMSEGALVRLLKIAGFNPKRIIIPSAVAVGGGLHYLQQVVNEVFPGCKLVLPSGEPCFSVNDLMYLMVGDKFKVGDMGFFNFIADIKDLNNVPDGDIPLNIANLRGIEFSDKLPPEDLLEYLNQMKNLLFSKEEA